MRLLFCADGRIAFDSIHFLWEMLGDGLVEERVQEFGDVFVVELGGEDARGALAGGAGIKGDDGAFGGVLHV